MGALYSYQNKDLSRKLSPFGTQKAQSQIWMVFASFNKLGALKWTPIYYDPYYQNSVKGPQVLEAPIFAAGATFEQVRGWDHQTTWSLRRGERRILRPNIDYPNHL